MDHHEIVKKLIGEIRPVGETYTDNERFENLQAMSKLIDQLLTDIDTIIPYKNRAEYSMKRAGELADKFFQDIGIIE